MAAFGSLIAGAGQGLSPVGNQIRQQQFEAGQQTQRLQAMRQQDLANRLAQNAEFYGGTGSSVGRNMHAAAAKAHTLVPGSPTFDTDLAKLEATHQQLVGQGEAQLAQNHAGNGPGGAQATGLGTAGIQPLESAPNALNSNPFASMIAQGAGPGSPPPAAQPSTSPLTSPAPAGPGGAGSPNAAFPGPAASSGPSAPGPVSPIGANAPVPGAIAPGPVPGLPPNLQASVDEFNSSGYMDPVLRGMLPGQTGLYQAKQKLDLIRPILAELGGITDENGMPDIGKLMAAEAKLSALGVQGGNMAPMLLGMLRPQSEPGIQMFGNLTPQEKDFYARTHPDEDLAKIPPTEPVRVQVRGITRQPVSIERQSQILHYATGPHGELIPVESRTAEALPAVQGAPGSPAPIAPGFVPQTSSSTLTVPGQLPQKTETIRQKGAPAASAGIPSVGPLRSIGAGSSPNSLVARKYSDWVSGGPAPTGKELTAVQAYAAANGLESPVAMSAKGAGDLAAIEPVLQEIQDLKSKLRTQKLDQDDSYRLVPDFLRYSHGLGSTPHDDLFTSLSFEQLRSAAAAMKGMNSRAFPILNRALQHTPTLDRIGGLMPDTPKTMYDKLNTMETILNQGRDAILRDERKSGVTGSPGPGGIPPVGAPAADPDGLRQFIRH